MNLLSGKTIKIDNKEIELKLSLRALYKAQKELKKEGLIDLFAGLDKLDMEIIYTVLRTSAMQPVTEDEILNADIDLVEIVAWMAESFTAIFQPSTEKQIEKK